MTLSEPESITDISSGFVNVDLIQAGLNRWIGPRITRLVEDGMDLPELTQEDLEKEFPAHLDYPDFSDSDSSDSDPSDSGEIASIAAPVSNIIQPISHTFGITPSKSVPCGIPVSARTSVKYELSELKLERLVEEPCAAKHDAEVNAEREKIEVEIIQKTEDEKVREGGSNWVNSKDYLAVCDEISFESIVTEERVEERIDLEVICEPEARILKRIRRQVTLEDRPTSYIKPEKLSIEPVSKLLPDKVPAPNISAISGKEFTYPAFCNEDPKAILLPLISDVEKDSPVNYRVQIITSTNEKMWVEVDSGSSVFWLRAHHTAYNPPKKPYYDTTNKPKSKNPLKTMKRWCKEKLSLEYASKEKVSFHLYEDHFKFSYHSTCLRISSVLFGAAFSDPKLDKRMEDSNSHGIMGISFGINTGFHHTDRRAKLVAETKKMLPIHGNIFQIAHDQGKLAEPVVAFLGPGPRAPDSIDIEGKEWSLRQRRRRGWLAVGWVKREFIRNCQQPIWCDQILLDYDKNSARKWYINLDAVMINDIVVATKQHALIDTGCAFIITGDAMFEKVKEVMGGVSTGEKTPSQFAYGGDGGFDLKSVKFVLGGKASTPSLAGDRVGGGIFALDEKDFSLGKANVDKMRKEVMLNNQKRESEYSDPAAIRNNMMISTIMKMPPNSSSLPDGLWVLGGIFIDNFVTIFDYNKKRVGFGDVPDVSPNPLVFQKTNFW